MAGPQHTFPPNFGGVPQNDMRSQFGGPRSGQLPGISSPGQQSASPQTYNVSVNMQQQADSPISAQQMQQSAQQTSQQLQMQMQQRQQTPSQQQQDSAQQAQQVNTVQAQTQQQTMPQAQQNAFPPQSSLPQHSAVPNAGGGQNMVARMAQGDGSIQSVTQSAIQSDNTAASAGASGPLPQQPPTNHLNTASLCKYGQEIVQDIMCKVQEIFQVLRTIMPPNGAGGPTNAISNEKKKKLQECLSGIKTLFKRLRIIYDKCNDNIQLQGMEYMHIESLIPLKEEWDVKTSEERKTSEAYRLANEECKDLIDQVVLKNSQLKEVIDHLRKIVWEINTMLTMRKS